MLRTRKSVTRVVCCAFIVLAASGAGLLVASKHGAMMMGRVTDAVCVFLKCFRYRPKYGLGGKAKRTLTVGYWCF